MNRIASFLLVLVGLMPMATQGQIDRSQAPAPAPAPEIVLGDYTVDTLENGLTLIVVENHKLPRVSYRLTLDVDPIFEGSRAGYTSMAGSLMRSGTKTRSKAEIDEAVDRIGASLGTSGFGMNGRCLVQHSETLLELMSDILMNPTFPEEELEKERKQTLSNFASSATDANTISGRLSGAMTYGLGHPYGESSNEKTVEAITRADLLNHYATIWKPNVAYLVVVGDITPIEAKKQAEQYFGDWRPAEVKKQRYPRPIPPKGNRVCFSPVPGAVQSVIDVTFPIYLKPGHPDVVAVSVMNTMLGGFFGSRLNQNLREDKAYTYGARSSASPNKLVGRFSARASVRNEVTDSSLVEFLSEIRKMVETPAPDSSLQFVKNYLNGSFALSLERPETIARFALNIERYGYDNDYYATYLSRLDAVTVEDVQRVARTYMRPDNMNITIAGNRDVADGLAQFAASGQVEFFDAYGEPLKDLEPAPEGMTAEDVFNAHYEARGGVAKFSKLKGVQTTGEMAAGPMTLSMEQGYLVSGAGYTRISAGGNIMQESKYDGQKGAETAMGQITPMDDAKILDTQRSHDVLEFLHLADYGLEAELLGVDRIDEVPQYLIEMRKDGKVSESHWFNVETGLRTRTVRNESTPRGDMTVTLNYGDTMEVKGLRFESEMTMSTGGQEMKMSIKEVKLNPKLNSSDYSVE
ncbi:insulinase family protein [Flavobacteriales bacterium]|nr:insulinase family protein [Flavobacteriales bacterium]